MNRAAPFLGLLIACGGGTTARSTVSNNEPAAGARCPAADRVMIAAFTSSTAGSWDCEGTPRWHMPLVIKPLDTDADRGLATPSTIEALRAAGAPDLPATVTMFRQSKHGAAAPCQAKVGTPYHAVGGDGIAYEELGVELTGCQAPDADDEDRLAWVSLDDAPGCTLVPAVEGGYRYSDTERWDRKPSGDAVLPAELRPFVPENPTGATPEALLWQTRVARAGDRTLAWELDTAQVMSPVGTESCNMDVQQVIQHFAVAGTRLVRATEVGHPSAWSHLDGVLALDGTPRVVLLLAVGSYTAIGIDPDGKPGEPRAVEFYIPHDEDNLAMGLVPYCGP